MGWIKDRIPLLKKAIEDEKINRDHLAIPVVCIHGDTNCARCADNELESNKSEYTWQNLEQDDIKRVMFMIPDSIVDAMKRHPGKIIIAGGIIRALVAGESIKDLDIFVPGQSEAEKWLDEVGLDYEIGDKYLTTEPSENFSYEIQTVWRYPFKEPWEIPEQFDYTVVKAAIWYDPGGKDKDPEFVGICHERFYRDIARRALVFCCERDTERVLSIPRILRYTQYGYSMDPKSMAEVIIKTCLSLDLSKGFQTAFKQLEDAYKPTGNDADWSMMLKPYVKPKRKKKRKPSVSSSNYSYGS